jgi:DNA-binding MurR/RpiR family transcriptional regulator
MNQSQGDSTMSPAPPAQTPPTTAAAIVAALTERFDGFSAQLQRAARFVVENQREVGVQSMRALAARAEVHPNTLVRLAQALGFEGWDEMRERFRDFVVSGEALGGYRDRATWLKQLAQRGGSAAVMAEMAEATGQNVAEMWRRQDPKTLERAADMLTAAPAVYVAGMGSAYSLAHQFWYVTRMAFPGVVPIPRHGSQPVDDLAFLTADDVLMALTFQPYRAETMAAVRLAREVGATVLGVTDSPTSPLARESDLALIAPTHSPQFFQSHAAATALLEGLIAVMVSRAGEDAADRIAAFHHRRIEAGIYAEPAALTKLG